MCLEVPLAAYQGIHAELPGPATQAGGAGSACLANPAWNRQDHLVAFPLGKRQALQSHFQQLRKLLSSSIQPIHAPAKLSGLKQTPGSLAL